MKFIISYWTLLFLLFSNPVAQNRWIQLNGPEGGAVTGLLAKGDTLIATAGYSVSNIYYSFDKGKNWMRSKQKLNDRSDSFFLDHDSVIVLAADGILKVYDWNTWTRVGNLIGVMVAVRRDRFNYLYAASGSGVIYNTTDEGLSWHSFNAPGVIGEFLQYKNRFFCGAQNKVLVKDSTERWRESLTIIDGNEFRFFLDNKNNLLAYQPNKIFKSSDTGQSWQQLPYNSFFDGNTMTNCIYNNRFIASFGDETAFVGDGWGAAVSDDEGLNWRWSTSGLPPYSYGTRLAKSGNETYLATMGGGIYKSTDFGDTWSSMNKGINASYVGDIFINKNSKLYTASFGNGISSSETNGESWEMINNGLNYCNFYSIIQEDQGKLFAGSDRGLFTSTDEGHNWVKTNNSPGFCYYFYKDNKNRIYTTVYSGGLYRTSDQGIHWTRIDNNLISSKVFSFTFDSIGNLYAGSFYGGIYKSTNDGQNWRELRISSNQFALIDGMVINSKGDIFAASIQEGILRSTDAGETWQNVKPQSQWIGNYPIAINKKDEIFTTGIDKKVWYSKDNGNSWIDISSNTKLLELRKIRIDNDENVILASDDGIWRSNPDSTTGIIENYTELKTYHLEQNYPNPFNPVTTIKYSLSSSGNVRISVFNILGKEVSTLVNEIRNAGTYEVNFNGSSLPSGIYFYRIESGIFSQTKKMLLLK